MEFYYTVSGACPRKSQGSCKVRFVAADKREKFSTSIFLILNFTFGRCTISSFLDCITFSKYFGASYIYLHYS